MVDARQFSYIQIFIPLGKSKSKMLDFGGDEWDPFEGVDILEVTILSLDELDLEVVIFTNDDG